MFRLMGTLNNLRKVLLTFHNYQCYYMFFFFAKNRLLHCVDTTVKIQGKQY